MLTQNIKTLLLDGYLDEPSCLGVPPYLSPHSRYLYGALKDGGIPADLIEYMTADQYRYKTKNTASLEWLEEYDLIIVLAGTTVPGHYLGGRPLSLTEINELGKRAKYPTRILAGPITLAWQELPKSREIQENYDIITGELSPADIYIRLCTQADKAGNFDPNHLTKILNGGQSSDYLAEAISTWAVTGAELFTHHPNHPKLIAEIETFRGCPRASHCSFCSEQLKKVHYQRRPEAIITEVEAIASAGVHQYRLGCQTDLLAYPWIQELYPGIRNADPNLKVLHLDNINPGPLGENCQQKAKEDLETICSYNTPGDVAAFGLESADPQVLAANNIGTSPELTLNAIRLINEIGGKREDGVPKLLPGLNFLAGLKGERKETYTYNLEFLRKIKDEGLLLRRINIRQVNALGTYEAESVPKKLFDDFKEKVNIEINKPMLQKIFPRGLILKQVWPEMKKGKLTFGRQPGSYPILIGIPGDFTNAEELQLQVIDHGYRSITALPYPFYINKATADELELIPGFGRKRAEKILLAQPNDLTELAELVGPGFPLEDWEDIFKFA
ncbi:MAG: radical SAM protein [Bacillota bacterium]